MKYVFNVITEHPIIARSSYYKIIKKELKKLKRIKLIVKIKEIFSHHKGCYGYRRLALPLIKDNWDITEKTVCYWLHKLGFKGIRCNKRKYSNYKRTIGKIAPNLIHRKFFAQIPNIKWYTDITEFYFNGKKALFTTYLGWLWRRYSIYTLSI